MINNSRLRLYKEDKEVIRHMHTDYLRLLHESCAFAILNDPVKSGMDKNNEQKVQSFAHFLQHI